jgi:hypothetical protein
MDEMIFVPMGQPNFSNADMLPDLDEPLPVGTWVDQ